VSRTSEGRHRRRRRQHADRFVAQLAPQAAHSERARLPAIKARTGPQIQHFADAAAAQQIKSLLGREALRKATLHCSIFVSFLGNFERFLLSF